MDAPLGIGSTIMYAGVGGGGVIILPEFNLVEAQIGQIK